MWARFLNYLEFVKFSHTVFALPFAFIAMLLAARGQFPPWSKLGWILLCMVTARTAAMSFNRWIDWSYDQKNPRTSKRAHLASRRVALTVTLITLILFIIGAGSLNALCLALAPVAILLILGYSLTKRFTSYSHAFLGLALAAAPMGAWTAMTGSLGAVEPWLLAVAVWAWVFGFDLIYATMDIEFDRRAGLHSYPSRHGIRASLNLAKGLHLLTWLLLLGFGWVTQLGLFYWTAMFVVTVALAYEHWLTRSRDVRQINEAFFKMNALVSLALILGVAGDLWIKF
jgi:4-hydroxybenzoate polyprenyltransferase